MYFRMTQARRAALWLAACALPSFSVAAGVAVRDDAIASPFPSNRFTVPEFGNLTYRRVNLPKPDCTAHISDCADIDVLNELDGFSTQPRITVPFTGAIDPSTVNSDSVYLLNLGDTLDMSGYGERVGINQVLWDPDTMTLVFEPDALLAEHSRYLLVVTNGVRDADGLPLKKAQGPKVRKSSFLWRAGRHGEYQQALAQALGGIRLVGRQVVGASLFTTQSATTDLVKIMRSIKRTRPSPLSFDIAQAGGTSTRAYFPVSTLAGMSFERQVGAAPAFQTTAVPLGALAVVPGAVGSVAYGRYQSMSYLNAEQRIPVVPTAYGTPRPQGSQDLVFQLFEPAGPKPAGGWPVVIFGHGFTDSIYGAPWTVASVFASRGLATLSINVLGHAGGPQGSLQVSTSDRGLVTVPAGGRGVDQDGNGTIDSTEGVNAIAPYGVLGNRDGLRQTVIDIMQLLRQVQTGMDADGDGQPDLNGQRIYYAGQSFGGIYGTMLLGVEPDIRAGVPNVAGGSLTEVARLGLFRFLTAASLATRQPSLLNMPPTPGLPVPYNLNFNENLPLRDLPAVVNDVPGALAIAEVLDRQEWAQQAGNPVSYASLIRKSPLRGSAAKPVIFQIAKGDGTVPNPTSTAILRAGDLGSYATYFRNDLAWAADDRLNKNPHTFLTGISTEAGAPHAVAAQMQMAVFFQSDGAAVIDPDGPLPIFEVPITLPLPETLNYLP